AKAATRHLQSSADRFDRCATFNTPWRMTTMKRCPGGTGGDQDRCVKEMEISKRRAPTGADIGTGAVPGNGRRSGERKTSPGERGRRRTRQDQISFGLWAR